MERGILYFLRGTKHVEHFLVSAYSLRKVWKGPVHVLCADSAACQVAHAASVCPILSVDWSEIAPDTFARNGTYCTKTKLPGASPFEQTIFADADTLFRFPFNEVAEYLFPKDDEFVLTSFANWNTAGKKISGRIRAWDHVASYEVDRQLGDVIYPAINTGVFAWTGDGGAFAKHWREMCLRNVRFICDEIAAQLIFPDHKTRVLSDVWNCSPVYSMPESQQQAAIFHGHGGKFFKSDRGWALWEPVFREACAVNAGGLADWVGARTRDTNALLSARLEQ